jgi:hypothetical protein
MDKETLSQYGWAIICIVVLAILIGLATPFGNFIEDSVLNATGSFDEKIQSDLGIESSDSNGPETFEQIASKYELKYYSTLTTAAQDINNSVLGKNADVEKVEDAKVAAYFDNKNNANIFILKDMTIENGIKFVKSTNINLGGNVITFENVKDGIIFQTLYTTETFSIDGRLAGSALEVYGDSPTAISLIGSALGEDVFNLNIIITGGTYIARSFATDVDENYLGPDGSQYCARVINSFISNLYVSDATILSSADNGDACGIINNGYLNIENSTIYSDAKYSDDGTNYIFTSIGINNPSPRSDLMKCNEVSRIKNCNITGTHSAIQTYKGLYIDGGTYQSVGHGGLYISAANETVSVKNATFKAIEYDGQYVIEPSMANRIGMYVGGGTGRNNIVVYIDNCKFSGTRAPFALRGTSNEKNNTIYISNSTINTDSKIRIDNDTHTLYLGSGNNFTASNTERPSRVFETNEIYSF